MDEISAQGGSFGNNTGASSRAPIFSTTHGTQCMLPLTYRGMQVGCSQARAGRSETSLLGCMSARWSCGYLPLNSSPLPQLLLASSRRIWPGQVDSCVSIAGSYLCWGQDTDAWEGCPQDVAVKQASTVELLMPAIGGICWSEGPTAANPAGTVQPCQANGLATASLNSAPALPPLLCSPSRGSLASPPLL